MEERDYMTKADINRELDKLNHRVSQENETNKSDRHELRNIMTKQNNHLAKIDGHLESIGNKIETIDKKVSKHEQYLDETERWKARLEGQIQVLRVLIIPVAIGITLYALQFVFDKIVT